MGRFVTQLESALDGTRLPADVIQTMHRERPLYVRYDLPEIAKSFSKEELKQREPTLWRYRELLPVPPNAEVISLGEGMTPLLHTPSLGNFLEVPDLWIKDESQLPTGSFKSRGMAMAITMAKHFGIKRVAVPTAGNAGGAMAAYAARAGMEAYVFMPKDTPIINQLECAMAGARTFLVDGLINDCAAIVRGGMERMGWFDCSTLKEPYRLEGKKTMGLELAEQFDWKLPDVIFYPTGGGTGLIGMWKAFHELKALGWLANDKLPKMVAVQSDGCAPIVRAFDAGERFATKWENAKTTAFGLRVPAAVGDFMILDAVRESGGWAMAAPEKHLSSVMRRATSLEGISICPETAACIAAVERARVEHRLSGNERVVIFNTGAGQKYADAGSIDLPVINDPHNVDYSQFS